MSGFDGSYLGASDSVSPLAIMECKICWTPYDPAYGDTGRAIAPGTPFSALPTDWSCPKCAAPSDAFVARGSQAPNGLQHKVDQLLADFAEVIDGMDRSSALLNPALTLEAVGFRLHEGRPLGVLVSEWFVSFVVMAGPDEDWSDHVEGEVETFSFPAGSYDFKHHVLPTAGGVKICAIMSPVVDIYEQAKAVELAQALVGELFDVETRPDPHPPIKAAASETEDMAEAGEDADDGIGDPAHRPGPGQSDPCSEGQGA